MDIKNLSWEQIKELAEMVIKNESDFSLTLCANGDCNLDISKHDYQTIPINTTSITTAPNITWNDGIRDYKTIPINTIPGITRNDGINITQC